MNHSTVGDNTENAKSRRLHRMQMFDGRRLLLEHLETRQLLAGDFLHGLLPPAPFQSQLPSLPAAEVSQLNGDANSSGRSERLQFDSSNGLANNQPKPNGLGNNRDGRTPHDHRGSQPDLGSEVRQSLTTAFQAPVSNSIAGGLDSSLASRPIGLRMTQPAMLPALPSGYELIDRFEVAPQTPTLPLSSSPSAQSGFEALIFADNNSEPPELILVAVQPGQDRNDTIESTLQERVASQSQLSSSGSQLSGQGLAVDSLYSLSTTSAETGAFDTALEEIFSSDESLASSNADGMRDQVREFVDSADSQSSVRAFVDSISSELRRKGITEKQIVELESLLQQIVASEGDSTESTTTDRYRTNRTASHSRSGVVFYDLRDAMMAVPIDDSAIASDPVGSLLESSNAWTQRFGLADVAMFELSGFATDSELARVDVSAEADGFGHSQWGLGERFDAALDTLPRGLIEGGWRPTLAKASLVVVACLAGMRSQQRPASESKATRKRPK